MTLLTEYAIKGSTDSDYVTFAALGVPAPVPHFQPVADTAFLANGVKAGLGFPQCPLDFGYLTIAQRNALRVRIPGISAAVSMVLPTKEYSGGNAVSNEVWKYYTCVADWPMPEPTEAGDTHKLMNFHLDVRYMVDVTPSS